MTRKDYNVELLVSTLQDFHKRWPHLRMILEPGSAFAWQTGPLVSSVVDIVENHGIRTAILDVSFTCHMPDCLEMPYYPEVKLKDSSISTQEGEGSQELSTQVVQTEENTSSESQTAHTLDKEHEGYLYRLGGNSCLAGDFMSSWLFPRELKVGDTLIFEDMIHYTTVKTTMFNGVHHPSIVIKHTDGTQELLRQYTYKDYLSRMD